MYSPETIQDAAAPASKSVRMETSATAIIEEFSGCSTVPRAIARTNSGRSRAGLDGVDRSSSARVMTSPPAG
jgi:hypothetical protein